MLAVAVEHRIGHLEVGDLAVVVAVGAVHRGAGAGGLHAADRHAQGRGADLEGAAASPPAGTASWVRPAVRPGRPRDPPDLDRVRLRAGCSSGSPCCWSWSRCRSSAGARAAPGTPWATVDERADHHGRGHRHLPDHRPARHDHRLEHRRPTPGSACRRRCCRTGCPIGTRCRGTRSTRRASRPTRWSDEDAEMMETAQDDAVVAALRADGQPVTEMPAVYSVTIGGPAHQQAAARRPGHRRSTGCHARRRRRCATADPAAPGRARR